MPASGASGPYDNISFSVTLGGLASHSTITVHLNGANIPSSTGIILGGGASTYTDYGSTWSLDGGFAHSGSAITLQFSASGWLPAVWVLTGAEVDIDGTPTSDDPGTVPGNTDQGKTGHNRDPVRYADGVTYVDQVDFESPGIQNTWGVHRSWINANHSMRNLIGSGWTIEERPYLLAYTDGTGFMASDGGNNDRYFDVTSAGPGYMDYKARFFVNATAREDLSTKLITIRDDLGNVQVFRSFDGSWLEPSRGIFVSTADAAGNTTAVTQWTTDGRIEQMQRKLSDDTVVDTFGYDYVTSGANTGLISRITWSRGGQTIRQADYTYYTDASANGSNGDLESATVTNAQAQTIDTRYYRYYKSGAADGFAHGLKYALGARAFARMAGQTDPFAASDATLAPYADFYYKYDSGHRVSQQTVAGFGSSTTADGQGTFLFSYYAKPSPGPDSDRNAWWNRTTMTLPSGNQEIVYTNAITEVMLKVFKDINDPANPSLEGLQWGTFYKYDSDGRIQWKAEPSAVDLSAGLSTLESFNDLLNFQSGNYIYLNDYAGRIDVTDYYTSTGATETVAGSAAGYVQDHKARQGEYGTVILLDSTDYFARSFGGSTVYPEADVTSYASAGGGDPRLTSYEYDWYTDSVQPYQITTHLPEITATGHGATFSNFRVYDTYGQLSWVKDEEAYLHYYAYDPSTGALTKDIEDVDTTETGDFSDLPSGWSTPTGGGLHLITNLVVDDLGRTTKLTDAAGRITYTVYKDAAHEIRTYAGWDTTAGTQTGPITLARQDRANNYDEVLSFAVTPHLTNNAPDGTEAITGLQSMQRGFYNNAGQLDHVDSYFDLTGLTYSTSAMGTLNEDFYRTSYSYGGTGRVEKITNATGTIQKILLDGVDRPRSIWIGTSDANLTEIAEYEYDSNGVGDGNQTKATGYPGGSADNRVTQYLYDWRGRLVSSKAGMQATEAEGTNRPLTVFTYNSLDHVKRTDVYDGDGVAMTDSDADGLPDTLPSSRLRARTETSFDEMGRAYQTSQYSIDQSDGTPGTALVSESWYDGRGNVIKSRDAGGLVTKNRFDGLGRLWATYLGDGGGDSVYADALTLDGDIIVESYGYNYDNSDNLILTTRRQRFHDATGTGELGNPASTTLPKARVSYVGNWYDTAGRLATSVNLGTYGGNSYTWQDMGTIPSRSNTALRTDYSYDDAGYLRDVVDRRNITTRSEYDDLGRLTRTIEAYVDGVPSSADDRITEYTYDGSDHVLTMTARLPNSAFQTTQYVYGATTARGDGINSNDILIATRYPDKTTGEASASEQESYTSNALGERLTKADRNGTTHTYGRDVLGRLTDDTVTTLGSGVDDAVLRLGYTYNVLGEIATATSYSDTAGSNIVNQVQREYNGLGQLTTEYQEHSGAVNTSTTAKTGYAYSSTATGSRLTQMIYPNGRVLRYEYSAGVDDSISRVSYLADDSGGSIGIHLEEYSYLGVDTLVRRLRPQPGNLEVTYVKQSGEPDGEAGDQYIGLDRFGRIIDQRWALNITRTVDRYQYGYDPDGNVLYMNRPSGVNHSELYHANGPSAGYDELNRITDFRRGVLSDTNSDGVLDTVTTSSNTVNWTMDALGNWNSRTQDSTTSIRTHNAQNEVTQIETSVLAFDPNGNTTTDERGYAFEYDAWNRLVYVQAGANNLAYAFDAMGRRIVEGSSHQYFSQQWQVIEETGALHQQYVWSIGYVDDLVLRDRDNDNNAGTGDYGFVGSGLEQRLYVLQDANYNVTIVVSAVGKIVERYAYDPYGGVAYFDGIWNARSSSNISWTYLHQGGRYDTVTGLYHFRNRDYSPTLGRWMQQDPAGYVDGASLYQYVSSDPVNRIDPAGLQREGYTPAPGVPGDPYSPGEVSKRQSENRRSLGLDPDPDTPIPDQGPGHNVKGSHHAKEGTPHRGGERNVNPREEHSRVAKGTGGKGMRGGPNLKGFIETDAAALEAGVFAGAILVEEMFAAKNKAWSDIAEAQQLAKGANDAARITHEMGQTDEMVAWDQYWRTKEMNEALNQTWMDEMTKKLGDWYTDDGGLA